MSKFVPVLKNAAFISAAAITFAMGISVSASSTADLSYPPQTVKIMAYGGERDLNITGYGEGAALNTWTLNGSQNENWRIDYVSSGVYKIVNVAADKLLSVSGNNASSNAECILMKDNGSDAQKWRIEGVEKDFLGNYLYYKIVNYANPSLALSWNTTTNEITLKNYTGANNQKWKLNCEGLTGFAGNCIVDEGEKAGTIGGLLGETVYVYNLNELKTALLREEPLTIVIADNIDGFIEHKYDLMVGSNKTIIGSYNANDLQDPKLRTDDYYKKLEPSDNIIIKNIDLNVGGVEDMMAIAVYGSKNVWIDHCSFSSTLPMYYDEVGKYIWVNTSSYAGENPDFVTVSYNDFNRKFWGVAFGADTLGENRATVAYNKFTSICQRAPQLGNGQLHALSNYYVRNEATRDNAGYASLKAGSGAQVYSDAQRWENYTKESSGAWDNEVEVHSNAGFTDNGSYTNRGETPADTPYRYTASNCSSSSWNPSSNYSYEIVSAYGGKDIKEFCNSYSGSAKYFDALKYINDSECSSYAAKKVSSPFTFRYQNSDEDKPDEVIEEGIADGGVYMIKNVNSGLYLDVAGGVAANGTNVQQWGATGAAAYNTWKLVSAGNGNYYIYSQVGGGNTYLLDLAYGNKGSGTNIQIWQNTYCDAQVFEIKDNGDGTYAILTKVTDGRSGLDVAAGSKSNGANVQQWGYTGGNHQKWIFERVK